MFSGCIDENMNSDTQLAAQTERSMMEANAQVGMPAIVNWKQKKDLKMLYEVLDQEGLITYAYLVSLDGKLVFLSKCVGYGMPYSTQYSNPVKAMQGDHAVGMDFTGFHDVITMPQPEPNGLFPPEGLSATWLMMIDGETGDVRPVYVEPQIIVSPIKLH